MNYLRLALRGEGGYRQYRIPALSVTKSGRLIAIYDGRADFDDLPQAVSLAEKYDEVYFAVGIHPYDIDEYDEAVIEKYVNHPKCIAIGECGLDYYRLPDDEIEKQENIKKQKEVFISQINLAKKYKKKSQKINLLLAKNLFLLNF